MSTLRLICRNLLNNEIIYCKYSVLISILSWLHTFQSISMGIGQRETECCFYVPLVLLGGGALSGDGDAEGHGVRQRIS